MMDMKNTPTEHSEWTDQLSAYMGGDLSPADFQGVEGHLAECGACRRVLEGLTLVVSRAHELGDIEPPRDLWGGIAATIQAPTPLTEEAGAKVIALPTSRRVRSEAIEGQLGRVSFSVPQLAAASVVLIAASAIATWVAGPGLGVRPETATALMPPSAVTMAANVASPPEGLADELSALEDALAIARSTLEPNTVRLLERNLGVIERAIEDSQQALLQDPGNEFLTDHLERVYQRKLTYLRDAARVAEWAG
jgi:hypothetical protein